jgi:hypothetical protein
VETILTLSFKKNIPEPLFSGIRRLRLERRETSFWKEMRKRERKKRRSRAKRRSKQKKPYFVWIYAQNNFYDFLLFIKNSFL